MARQSAALDAPVAPGFHPPMSDARTAPGNEPFDRLADLIAQARAGGVELPEACALATADPSGRPAARMVLCRGLDPRGLVFYTNLDSAKGLDLAANPRATLLFHFPLLVRQVGVDGPVVPVAANEADAYWAGRPRESQIGAWASAQSRPIASRAALDGQFAEADRRFADGPVPRPPRWSGLRVVPERFEFWEGRIGRLHHREQYTRDPAPGAAGAAGWVVGLLQP